MTDPVPSVEQLAATWRAEADRLERFAPPAAVAFRDCAVQLELALRAASHEVLTLSEASLRSGLSVDHLRHLVAAGEIRQAGRKGSPRIRAGDLPVRAATRATGPYDVDTDARRLSGGRR